MNGEPLKPGCYSNVGAYVQQDDVLCDLLTIRELLTFSVNIRSKLRPDEVETKVSKVVERLGLAHCQDQVIGGLFNKGISGGERKRASIGYELITDPFITLLDEPTSGLDSHTALMIVKLLREETKRGMGILCTIHQPSAQILSCFDRIILLSEGYQIFQGTFSEITTFFEKYKVQMPKYGNPADKLITLASTPKLVLRDNATFQNLVDEVTKRTKRRPLNP